ncbi:PP2C family protein-serine/threonine phosphatase [Niveibacterium terrae]|uniref:PP2C family protein-serine/threonine phosphatase n=1 Tax=Niveibacterium terrae TaxID=3373598 RepID=UPI003A8CD403
MIVDIDARCDIGCVRQNNEDMVLVADRLLRDAGIGERFVFDPPGERLVLAVADGMGGAAAGEWASEYALTRLREILGKAPADLDGDELRELIGIWAELVHAELLAEGGRNSERLGMGTTVVGLLIRRTQAWRFHAGDSRLYRLRGALLERLTCDHSARQTQGDASLPANLLTNSLGGGRESWLEVAEIEGGVLAGDRFLLCSDGVHDLVADDRLAALLLADRETALRSIIQLARDAGGYDNISALIADIGRSTPSSTVTADTVDGFYDPVL